MLRLIEVLYLMLPVYAANMAPPFVKFWPWWNRPIDRRRLGDHKTIVGFAFGIAVAVATTALQRTLAWSGGLVDYGQWLPLGLSCGFAAMAGDSLKSLFKRRLRIAPGSSWVPADQLDFVVAGLIVLSLWTRLTWLDISLVLGLSFVADIAVNHFAFWLKIRDTPW
ncbi:MAG: CDP-archaeol synthase [Nevskia sp.]|nr:CDP-archaeol synthase [Nevskia sp.]